jgi:hypothetical protein
MKSIAARYDAVCLPHQPAASGHLVRAVSIAVSASSAAGVCATALSCVLFTSLGQPRALVFSYDAPG